VLYNSGAQIVGVVLLAVGCWYLSSTKVNDVNDEMGLTSLSHYAAILVCVIGSVIIIVSILGFIAAFRENSILLFAVSRLTIICVTNAEPS